MKTKISTAKDATKRKDSAFDTKKLFVLLTLT